MILIHVLICCCCCCCCFSFYSFVVFAGFYQVWRGDHGGTWKTMLQPYTKGVWNGRQRYNFFRIHLPFNGLCESDACPSQALHSVLISAIVSGLDIRHRELKHHTPCMFTANYIPRLSRINQRVNRPTDKASIFTTYRAPTLSRITHTTTIQSATPATTTLTTIL